MTRRNALAFILGLILGVAAACGIPTSQGIAKSLHEEFSPITITLVNGTGETINKLRICPTDRPCKYVPGEMIPLETASVGPLPLGEAFAEWWYEDGSTQIQSLFLTVTNPVYVLRRPK